MSSIPAPGYLRLFNSYRTLLESIVVITFAFLFCFACGQRGIFPLDQSIVWDGAYRILRGQEPFRDFVFPHSLLVLYLQAGFFWALGISYYSYVITAALMNAVACIIAMRVVALLYPASRRAAVLAGLLTALWFFPAFGTPYGEHTAFLLGLIGIDCLLTAILRADEARPSGSARMLFAAGVCAGLAFYAKQNIAAFLWPFFLLTPAVAWLPDSRRFLPAVRWIFFGLCTALLFPALIIAANGNWRSFLYFYLLLPAATALRRFAAGESQMLNPQAWALWIGIAVVVGGSILAVRRKLRHGWQALIDSRSRFLHDALAGWCALYILLLSYFIRRSMLNNPTIADVYVGVLFGLAYALVSGHAEGGVRSGFAKVLVLLALVAAIFGGYVGWERKVQESVDGAYFGEALTIPGLEGLRWGEPTVIQDRDSKVTVSEADLTALVEYLRQDGRNFFVFPDFSFLYAVLGSEPPQPLLFFHRGLTYPERADLDIDNLVVDTLITNQVAVIVLETYSFFGTERRLEDFPVLAAFIRANFSESTKFGLFTVLTLKTLDEAPEENTEDD